MGKEQIIKGVIVKDLRQIIDDRGRVMHMLSDDNPLFKKFGELYFSEVLPDVVKAWKRHKRMTQLFAVPVGTIKLVIYDDRENSVSKGTLIVLEIGRDNYQLVKIPPRLWYGFKCISEHAALIVNCADFKHRSNEYEECDTNDSHIPYNW